MNNPVKVTLRTHLKEIYYETSNSCSNHQRFTQRALTDKMAGKWEFPGGKIEPGETPEACLAREIVEELGVTIDVGDFFADSIYTYEFGSIQLLGYWATIENGQITLSVHNDFRWVSFSELNNYDFCPADIHFVNKLIKGELI